MNKLAPISLFALIGLATPVTAYPLGYDYGATLRDNINLYQAERIVRFRERQGRPVTSGDWTQYEICMKLRAFNGFYRNCNLFLY